MCWQQYHQKKRKMRSPAHVILPFLLLLTCASLRLASANKFTVGDAKAWNPNVNYTEWVNKHKPFYVGDWLVFYYTNGQADVVQVADEAAYNKCDASHPVSNYSKGRSYAFELNETKRYYFICSLGFCYGGMKLSIRAQPLPPPSPPPSSKPSAASTTSSSSSTAAIVLAVLILMAML